MASERERLREDLGRGPDLAARALVRDVPAGPEPAADPQLAAVVRRAQAGDAAAREELIGRFLPFVSALARRHGADGLEQVDLVQEGCVGVLRALARFDPSRGVPFPAYASWWIRQALENQVLSISGTRVPVEAGEAQRVERPYGSFVRTLTLPQGVDPDSIVADFAHGVLMLHVPKPAGAKPRKIAIGGSSRQAIEQ